MNLYRALPWRLQIAAAALLVSVIWYPDYLAATAVLAALVAFSLVLVPRRPTRQHVVVVYRPATAYERAKHGRRWIPTGGVGLSTHGPFAWLGLRRWWR